MDPLTSMPLETRQGLEEFLDAAKTAFGDSLISAVLFGSAAEGRLRSTSDINLMLVLQRFDKDRVDTIRERFRAAHAAIRLEVMFLLAGEMERAMDAFAVKFSDILTRRAVLFGADPFGDIEIPRDAIVRRTAQVLMNLVLRMRERYALVSLREEQLAHFIADITGPLRACASSILKLEVSQAASPKEALLKIISDIPGADGPWISEMIDKARRYEPLPEGAPSKLLFMLLDIAGFMQGRLDKMRVVSKGEGLV